MTRISRKAATPLFQPKPDGPDGVGGCSLTGLPQCLQKAESLSIVLWQWGHIMRRSFVYVKMVIIIGIVHLWEFQVILFPILFFIKGLILSGIIVVGGGLVGRQHLLWVWTDIVVITFVILNSSFLMLGGRKPLNSMVGGRLLAGRSTPLVDYISHCVTATAHRRQYDA